MKVDKGIDEKSIQNIQTRRNYTEVLPKDLCGLSSTRIVEFRIYLVPGTAPVTKINAHMYRLPGVEQIKHQELITASSNRRPIRLTTRPTYFSKIDLLSGYHHIRVKEEDTPRQRSRRVVIDDILIYSRSKEEHEQHLDTVLRFLKE
ncbi:hypothetical protein Tco_0958134 [Tanacetum coccineum]